MKHIIWIGVTLNGFNIFDSWLNPISIKIPTYQKIAPFCYKNPTGTDRYMKFSEL